MTNFILVLSDFSSLLIIDPSSLTVDLTERADVTFPFRLPLTVIGLDKDPQKTGFH